MKLGSNPQPSLTDDGEKIFFFFSLEITGLINHAKESISYNNIVDSNFQGFFA